jgi:hypothetical protein
MRRTLLTLGLAAAAASVAAQGTDPKPQRYKGLEIAVTGVERAASAGLSDCPPGANTQRAMTRPGEQFAIVSVAFKVLPDYKETMLKRPVLRGEGSAVFNTAATFVDPGKTPSYTCQFPFRVPDGAKLKALEIETISFDLSGLDVKKP